MKLGQKLAINYLRARLNLLAVFSTNKAAQKAVDIFCTPFYKSNKKAPPIFEQAENLSIRVKDIVAKGYRWNAGGTKKILILHGFESTVKNFDAYINALINKNYEVLAFDAPAHGESGGTKITLPLYIEMIENIHFMFGKLDGLIAHSFGGLAAAHFIENASEQRSMRLALIAPATETKTAIDTFFHFLQLSNTVRLAFEKILAQMSGVPPGYFSIPRAMQHINAAVLWVHDKDDDITPIKDVQPLIDKNYPHISFMITEGLGHKKIYRDGNVIQAVVDFL